MNTDLGNISDKSFTPAYIGSEFKDLLQGFADQIATQMVSVVGPIVLVGLTLYFTVKGYAAISGRSQNTIQDTFWECGKISLIAFFALSAPNFVGHVMPFIDGIQAALSQAVSPGRNDVWGVLNEVYVKIGMKFSEVGERAIRKAMEDFSLFGEDSIYEALSAFLILTIATGTINLGIALFSFVILSCEVGLAMVIGFGPLFMCALMFPATKQWFEGWLRSVVGLIFTMVLSVVLIHMMFHIASQQVDYLETEDILDLLARCILVGKTLVLQILVFIFIFFKISSISNSLVGGLSLNGFNPSGIAGDVKTIHKAVSKAGKAALAVATGGTSTLATSAINNLDKAIPNSMRNNAANIAGSLSGNDSKISNRINNSSASGKDPSAGVANNKNFSGPGNSSPANDERSFNSSNSSPSTSLQNHIRGSWGLGPRDENDKAS